jgi:hypothetical protein
VGSEGAPTIGSVIVDGCSLSWKIVCSAISQLRILTERVTGIGIAIEYRKLLLEISSRIWWPALNRLLVGHTESRISRLVQA